ncbi:dihydropteroate synthase [Steroidobacter sp.]|uniref:dihydropteroate synthase n=1 Tax=Steroidobacter sp. TaxID=1978227 RepID=UPI002ED82E2A
MTTGVSSSTNRQPLTANRWLRCGRHTLDLSQPVVMGILNVTPDSFSDGGRFIGLSRALEQAQRMIEQGAGMIDVGGESTRPGAADVSEEEEIRRVIPVIEALAARTSVPISVDTSKAAVMSAAVAAGASLINDVRALREPGALEAAASTHAAVCLMHMQGQPRTMQHEPHYEDVVGEVTAFLEQRIEACAAAGIGRERLVLDPGIGFGKRLEHNLTLLAHLPQLGRSGVPVLVGVSRKSMFQTLLGRPVEQRLAGGLAVATAAVLAGAAILRVHDVAETVDAVKVAQALRAAGYQPATS